MSVIAMFFPVLVLTSSFKFLPLGDDGGSLNSFQKMFVFYKTPLVKYIGNGLSYIIFLILYSYVALFDFQWKISYVEMVLYIWFLILIIDEMREVGGLLGYLILLDTLDIMGSHSGSVATITTSRTKIQRPTGKCLEQIGFTDV